MNLNEILEMLEKDVTAPSMTKEASEKEVPAGAEKFTKTASAIKEAEELGAQVAATLLKAAEEECKEKETEAEAKDKAEDKKETKSDKDETKTEKEEDMDKKASLVDVISAMLEKSALNEGSDNVATSAVVPNIVQADNAAIVADFDGVVAPTPGTDGVSQGGTVNQILDAIVAKAQGQGTVEIESDGSAAAERNDPDVEKTAAVIELVNNGVDFDSAVNMVKQAAFEIEAEEFEVEKQAAFGALIEAGVDFDAAADMVKEAALSFSTAKKIVKGKKALSATGQALLSKAKGFAGDVAHDAKQVGGQVSRLATGKVTGGKQSIPVSRQAAGGALLRNKAVQVAAGTTAVAGGAYAATREKKAAFDALVADGVDFETAASCVAQASQELYGC
jgi:hypothetical protein